MNKTEKKRILAVDDEPNMRRLLEIMLKQAGYQPLLAASGREALEILAREGADLVVSDLHMPGMDGLGLLAAMQKDGMNTPAIIVTAHAEVETAVAAMKLGAADYIVRPFDLEMLEIAMMRALSLTRLKIENRFLRDEAERDVDNMIGDSPAMRKVYEAIRQVAPEKATALIVGETGTGKELVAHAIHKLSPRNDAMFVAVNCAAIPADMLESELFGHERGAFTGAIKERIGKFELADGGTLFLDEVTEMPVALQAKLLRALQEGVIERLGGHRPINVNIRVVAATNRDPQQAVRDGQLREDLYYRLNVFRLDLPPLRERSADIPALAQHFVAQRNMTLAPDTLNRLAAYRWPGNVRELQNVLERAAIMCSGDTITAAHLPADLAPDATPAPDTLSIPEATEALERRMIAEALKQTNGNKSKAARLLNISERSLWYKLTRYDLG
ncbi:MAG: sigma-54 dependent transcriptional regulator [Methylobacillus sp.]|jgi:two-component system response regulator AtoC|nr:sigma-54 dependent transcriptional regulator [Methylobacillus sp.]